MFILATVKTSLDEEYHALTQPGQHALINVLLPCALYFSAMTLVMVVAPALDVAYAALIQPCSVSFPAATAAAKSSMSFVTASTSVADRNLSCIPGEYLFNFPAVDVTLTSRPPSFITDKKS
jgi:hypothetical protein